MPKNYRLTPLLWLVRDEAGVKFHIKSDDYFGTIAAILSLLKQEIKKGGDKDTLAYRTTLNNLEKDLLFLQKNYEIKRRPYNRPLTQNKNSKPKGKLKSQ